MDFESLFDLPIDDLHTPCYLTDARLLQKNTALLKQIQQETGCKILLAQYISMDGGTYVWKQFRVMYIPYFEDDCKCLEIPDIIFEGQPQSA